ncbi:MAG: RebB family R body protein [Nannocystaceae bacterium]
MRRANGGADFPGTARAVGAAVAQVMGDLAAVLSAQRRDLVDLAARGGAPSGSSDGPDAAKRIDPAAARDLSQGTGSTDAAAHATVDDPEALACGAVYQAAAHAIALAFANAVAAQQLDVLGQAITAKAAVQRLDRPG